MGCSRKNPQFPSPPPRPLTDGIVEILVGVGSKTLEIQVGEGGGGLNLKKSSAVVILTDSSRDLNV